MRAETHAAEAAGAAQGVRATVPLPVGCVPPAWAAMAALAALVALAARATRAVAGRRGPVDLVAEAPAAAIAGAAGLLVPAPGAAVPGAAGLLAGTSAVPVLAAPGEAVAGERRPQAGRAAAVAGPTTMAGGAEIVTGPGRAVRAAAVSIVTAGRNLGPAACEAGDLAAPRDPNDGRAAGPQRVGGPGPERALRGRTSGGAGRPTTTGPGRSAAIVHRGARRVVAPADPLLAARTSGNRRPVVPLPGALPRAALTVALPKEALPKDALPGAGLPVLPGTGIVR